VDVLIFYTNYNSEKGKAIAYNSNVSLSFFWPQLERQVIIKGNAEKTSSKVSDQYFNKRPIDSRLGAIVSNQSDVIEGREVLDNKLATLKISLDEINIKRPAHWGGFIVKPISFEFWQGRPNRLHDRFLFSFTNDNWSAKRLAP
ncbi:MAG: pyridoxamine 5'-phosphate oxidase, partial [Flavobacteriaceae bacterium]|nr:pyridoxamine 5'-phosphate oxidase [Flavobacteriaceae bacterium]